MILTPSPRQQSSSCILYELQLLNSFPRQLYRQCIPAVYLGGSQNMGDRGQANRKPIPANRKGRPPLRGTNMASQSHEYGNVQSSLMRTSKYFNPTVPASESEGQQQLISSNEGGRQLKKLAGLTYCFLLYCHHLSSPSFTLTAASFPRVCRS